MEFRYRSFFRFIEYDWENSQAWKNYLEQNKSKEEDLDNKKRKFFHDFVDQTFDMQAVMDQSQREEFLSRSKYHTHLHSLHNNRSPVKFITYLSFLLLLPINTSLALYCYLLALTLNTLMNKHSERQGVTLLQSIMTDEDSFTLTTLLFMQFSNFQIRLVYTGALCAWAVLVVSECGFNMI